MKLFFLAMALFGAFAASAEFDRTNPVDLATLKSEVQTDPLGCMGYAAVVDQTTQLLKLLNEPAANCNGDTAARPFTSSALLDALTPTELEAAQTTVGAGDYIVALILAETNGGLDISPYKSKFSAMFAGNSATATALASQTAPLSRAEVLFGQGTVISRDDWFAARDS